MSTNREPTQLDIILAGERDAFEPFYLTVIETNPGKFDLRIDPGEHFDTREKAEAYLTNEVATYGVGGHVYHCVRVSGLSTAPDEDPVLAE